MSTRSGPGPRSISTWAWAEGESLQLNTQVLVNSILHQTHHPCRPLPLCWVACPHTCSQASANLSPAAPTYSATQPRAGRSPFLLVPNLPDSFPTRAPWSGSLLHTAALPPPPPAQACAERTLSSACEAGGFSGARLQPGHRTTCRPLCSFSFVGKVTTIHSPSRNSLCARPSPQGTLRRQSKVAPKQQVAQAGAPEAEGGQTQPSTGVPPGLAERL